MNKDEFESLWDELKQSWDTEEPTPGHRERFEQRLIRRSERPGQRPGGRGGKGTFRLQSHWVQWVAAASIALLLGMWVGRRTSGPDVTERVSEVSPEARQSAYYFAGIIEEQIRELEDARTPETAPMIRSALAQIRILEEDYSQLERALLDGGNTPLILKAMVTNFQTRIDLLNDVLAQVNEFKLLNTQNHEENHL